MLLAVAMAQAVVLNNYLLAGVAVLIAVLAVLLMRRHVKEVVADERDYKIAGDAARWSLAIFAVGTWLVSFVFIMLRTSNPTYELVGAVLAYAVLALLLLHSGIVYFLKGREGEIRRGRAVAFALVALVIALAFAAFGARLFSGEDDWICNGGQWVMHGHPSAPMPTEPCR